MDLRLTKRGDYVMRAAISLGRAYESGEYRKIREVASEMELPARYTPQILHLLLKAGLAEARAGQKGGYRLLKSPEKLTLLEIVEAAEGPLWPQRCTLRGGPCHWERECAIHPAWEEAYRAVAAALSRSLASVLAIDRELEAGHATLARKAHPTGR